MSDVTDDLQRALRIAGDRHRETGKPLMIGPDTTAWLEQVACGLPLPDFTSRQAERFRAEVLKACGRR